ncbi:hypothetical protein [Singapore grouper iridovirus]|nr:hypothetical protein [Singapore grouper iridovirus]
MHSVKSLLVDISKWELNASAQEYVAHVETAESPATMGKRPKVKRVSKRPVCELLPPYVDESIRRSVGSIYHAHWPKDRLRPTVEKQAVLVGLITRSNPELDVNELVKTMRVKCDRLKKGAREAEKVSHLLPAPWAQPAWSKEIPDMSKALKVLGESEGRKWACWAQSVTCIGVAICSKQHEKPFRSVWKDTLEKLRRYAPAALLRSEYGSVFFALCVPLLAEMTGAPPQHRPLEWWAETCASVGHELVRSTVQGAYLKHDKDLLRRMVYTRYFEK